MHKVIDEFKVKDYLVMILDNEKPLTSYNKYLIDGIEFDIVPIYDAPKGIAIISDGSFLNKNVEFI